MSEKDDRLRELVANVAAAYLSNTQTPPEQIAGILHQIAASLEAIGRTPAETYAAQSEASRATAVQIRDSIRPDGITSFEDGRSYKTLRRHLTGLGMTPGQYRQKWGLPADYPMVAPSLSAVRSELARRMRLGRSPAPVRTPPARAPGKPRGKRVSG